MSHCQGRGAAALLLAAAVVLCASVLGVAGQASGSRPVDAVLNARLKRGLGSLDAMNAIRKNATSRLGTAVSSLTTSSTPATIRVHVEYQNVSGLTASNVTALKRAVNLVVLAMKKYIKVRQPVSGKLLVPAGCAVPYNNGACALYEPDFRSTTGNSTWNAYLADSRTCITAKYNRSHFDPASGNNASGPGVDADFIIYVTSVNTYCLGDDGKSDGTIAYATGCNWAPTTNRPLVGMVNWCPPQKELLTDPDGAMAVMLHELVHALGFASDMFPRYINPATGVPYSPSAFIQKANAYGMTANVLTTPNVKAFVRSHFNCSTAEGGYMEDEGGAGSAGSHWEYTQYQGEFMVAVNLQSTWGGRASFSEATMSLLDDTGWYVTNRSNAGKLIWGKNAGCTFLKGTKCPSSGYSSFCSTSTSAHSCAPDSRYISSTCINSYGFNDECGLPLYSYYAQLPSSGCTDTSFAFSPTEVSNFGWKTGASSRCIKVSSSFKMTSGAGYTSGWYGVTCYPMTCNAAGTLKVNVKGTLVTCSAGATINLNTAVSGGGFAAGTQVYCPSAPVIAQICDSLSCGACNNKGGDCVGGKCYCSIAYTGSDCSKRIDA